MEIIEVTSTKLLYTINVSNYVSSDYMNEYHGLSVTSEQNALSLVHQLFINANSKLYNNVSMKFKFCKCKYLLPELTEHFNNERLVLMIDDVDEICINLTYINTMALTMPNGNNLLKILVDVISYLVLPEKKINIYYKIPYSTEQYVLLHASLTDTVNLINYTRKYLNESIVPNSKRFMRIIMKRSDISEDIVFSLIKALNYNVNDLLSIFISELEKPYKKLLNSSNFMVNRLDRLIYLYGKLLSVVKSINKYKNRYVELLLRDYSVLSDSSLE